LFSVLEWTAFLCSHAHYGQTWKTNLAESAVNKKPNEASFSNCVVDAPSVDALSVDAPIWVSLCFKNEFRSPFGFFAILGE
jgi:hypothetical protein